MWKPFHKAKKKTNLNQWKITTELKKFDTNAKEWVGVNLPAMWSGLIWHNHQAWKVKTMVLSNKYELHSDSVTETKACVDW